MSLTKQFLDRISEAQPDYKTRVEKVLGKGSILNTALSGNRLLVLLVVLKDSVITDKQLLALERSGMAFKSIGVMGSGKFKGKLFVEFEVY